MLVRRTIMMQLDAIYIGDSIRRIRKKHGLTQMEASEGIGINYIQYSRIESGTRGLNLKNLYRMMEFYKVDANTLLGLKEVLS
jgi:transcriptional regulator with XRE-family HTH domain